MKILGYIFVLLYALTIISFFLVVKRAEREQRILRDSLLYVRGQNLLLKQQIYAKEYAIIDSIITRRIREQIRDVEKAKAFFK